MSNNRMWIVEKNRGIGILIARSYVNDQYWVPDIDLPRLFEFFNEIKDDEQDLELFTEKDGKDWQYDLTKPVGKFHKFFIPEKEQQ